MKTLIITAIAAALIAASCGGSSDPPTVEDWTEYTERLAPFVFDESDRADEIADALRETDFATAREMWGEAHDAYTAFPRPPKGMPGGTEVAGMLDACGDAYGDLKDMELVELFDVGTTLIGECSDANLTVTDALDAERLAES